MGLSLIHHAKLIGVGERLYNADNSVDYNFLVGPNTTQARSTGTAEQLAQVFKNKYYFVICYFSILWEE